MEASARKQGRDPCWYGKIFLTGCMEKAVQEFQREQKLEPDGVIIKDLYTAIYDENGCLSGYTVVPYIGKRPRDGRLEGINVKHQGNKTFELSEKEKLDTEKDALRWKYPPTYFS